MAKTKKYHRILLFSLCLVGLSVAGVLIKPTDNPSVDVASTERNEIHHVKTPETPSTMATEKPAVKSTAPAASAGRRIFLDSATGELRPPLSGEIPLTTAVSSPPSTSSAGLVESQVTMLGGGIMVDLQGRFRSAVVVTVDAEGKLSTHCVSSTTDTVKPQIADTSQTVTEGHASH